MTNPTYYISSVRYNLLASRIEAVGVTESLGGRQTIRERSWVVSMLQHGWTFRTAYIEYGRWVAGDEVIATSKGFITTRGNQTERDNLGNLPSL